MADAHTPTAPDNFGATRSVVLARVLGAVFVGLISVPSPAIGDTYLSNTHLIAKGDVRQLFAITKQQWYETVRHAAASGMAIPIGRPGGRSMGMTVGTPDGTVSTVLRYDIGDRRPSAVLFAMAYPSGKKLFTSRFADQVLGIVKRQMAPEFHVVGNTELDGDTVALFFFFTQSQTAPRTKKSGPTLTGHPPTGQR